MNPFEGLSAVISLLSLVVAINKTQLPVKIPFLPSPTPAPYIQELPLNKDYSKAYKVDGKYTYLGTSVNYKLNIPKMGGDISGEFNGVCNGTITGTFNENLKQIDGTLNGSCDTPLFKGQFNQPFFAKISDNKKEIEVQIRDKKILDIIGTLKIPISE